MKTWMAGAFAGALLIVTLGILGCDSDASETPLHIGYLPPSNPPADIAAAIGDLVSDIPVQPQELITPGLLTVSHEPDVKITHYGTRFNGRKLGCGEGTYSSDDVTIVAVATERNKQWRCGMLLHVCGPGGCIVGVRQDTCPGCETNHLDLTESGLDAVCGAGQGVCRATVSVYAAVCMIPENIEATRQPVPAPDGRQLIETMTAQSPAHRIDSLIQLSSGAMSKSCAMEFAAVKP